MKFLIKYLAIPLSILLAMSSIPALEFALPENGDSTVGEVTFAKIQSGQDLSDIARQYDMGFDDLHHANPSINPERLLLSSVVIVPSQFVLPNTPHQGIVINIPEKRLYFFPKHKRVVYTFPIGVGRQDWRTPVGKYKIIQKMKDPYWQVPASIMAYRKKHGDPVQKIMPAGPDNPLGKFAMRLSNPTYLIHGTIEPKGVGREVSAGCIRLYPEDIKQLFKLVTVGTPVRIVNEPVKIGLAQGDIVVEAHPPLAEQANDFWADLPNLEQQISHQYGHNQVLDWQNFYQIVHAGQGLPELLKA